MECLTMCDNFSTLAAVQSNISDNKGTMMNLQRKILAFASVLLTLLMAGCAASDESSNNAAAVPPPPSATEVMQKEMTDLKNENTSLKGQIAKLQQDNSAATAHAAEMETQLADIRAKLAA